MSIYLWLYKRSLGLRRRKAGKTVYDLFEATGIRIIVSRFFNRLTVRKEYNNPTERIKKSREFFANNEQRVNRICDILEDEESKKVYRAMIKFRCSSKYSDLPDNHMRTQYFENDFFRYDKTHPEVFLDCGAYDGDSIQRFKKYMKKRNIPISKIIAFEADSNNFDLLKLNHSDVISYNACVWNRETHICFSGNNLTGTGKETNDCEEGVSIRAITIDNCRECDDVTFIKMDIEGAEMYALEGAKKRIIANRPKLAICIYHSDEDMIRINCTL